MKILFLDDDHARHEVFDRVSSAHMVTSVYDADSAIAALAAGQFDLVYLDHDLGGEASEGRLLVGAKDGRYVARWIWENASKFLVLRTLFVIHSLNVAGGEAMMGVMREQGLDVHRRPFAWKIAPHLL